MRGKRLLGRALVPLGGFLGLLTLAGANGAPTAGAPVSGAARVIDGDTIAVDGRRVRLVGIDAAERGQACGAVAVGEIATTAVRAAVNAAGGRVVCSVFGVDHYGRALGRCTAAGVDLAAAAMRSGAAIPYDLVHGWRYLDDLAAAVVSGAGAWRADVLPECETPRQHRRRG